LEAVEHHARTHYLNQALVFGATGSVEPARWTEIVQKKLGGFVRIPTPEIATSSFTLPTTLQRREKTHTKEQAVMLFAFPTVPLAHADHVALALLSEALSDLGSRLFIKIREELGLAYFVGAAEFLGTAASIFYFYVGTDPKKRPLIEAAMLEEIHGVAAHGLTPVELARARAKQLSQEQLAAQNPSHVLASAALDELCGLGYDFEQKRQGELARITLEEVNQVAKNYFSQKGLVIATVSPQ
jgi:zinc protease